MKLISYIRNEKQSTGAVVNNEYVVDLNIGFKKLLADQKASFDSIELPVSNLRDLLEKGSKGLQLTRTIISTAELELGNGAEPEELIHLIPTKGIQLISPLPNPSKVIAIGQNYRDHCLEQDAPIPEKPIVFAKFPSSVIGPGEVIRWDPKLARQVDYEAELGVVIGKTAQQVSQVSAFDYVAGYVNANDVSARDLQFGDGQWVRGKSLDTFCPIGPYLVTKDEIQDPHHLSIRSVLNGNVMQSSNTRNLIFKIPYLLEFITHAITLYPGDIILTGTPPGVGVFRDPKVLMKPGDTISVEVEGLGKLTNPVAEWV